MEKKTKNIVLICLGLVLILLIGLLVLFLVRKSNSDTENGIITTKTTTTTTQKTDIVLENNGIKLTISDSEITDYKLFVEEVLEKVKDVNVLAVYDITLKDADGNIKNVSNANIKIAIPYENTDNWTKWTVLYLNENNEVLETYNASYENGNVVFNVNHLSRYAIVGEKEEVETTTKTTSKKTTNKTTTEKTTTKTTTTIKPTTKTTTKSTTKTTTKSTTTTKATTTTTKAKTYSYEWSKEGDQAGKYYLYVVDESGNKVAGTVTLTSKATGSSKTFDIPASGRLFVKDNYTVSNAKGN